MEVSQNSIRVGIVEDEAVLREELAFQLRHLGFDVVPFEGASQLYRHLAVKELDAVVLDIGLAGEDGLSISFYLREHDKRIGIVFVTARVSRDDRLTGLHAGADGYLTKPIDVQELALLLRRLAERVQPTVAEGVKTARSMPSSERWRLEPAGDRLRLPDGRSIRLTLNEVRLMRTLLEMPGEIVGPSRLAQALGLLPDEFNKHRVEVIISRLREKVLRETTLALPVRTRRGQGYAFEPELHDPRAFV